MLKRLNECCAGFGLKHGSRDEDLGQSGIFKSGAHDAFF